MTIPLCCVFSTSFIQADFNVYYIKNMGLQHSVLQKWDAGAPGASGLLPLAETSLCAMVLGR